MGLRPHLVMPVMELGSQHDRPQRAQLEPNVEVRTEAGEAGAWLWSIALRRLIDHLRRRPHPTPTATLPEPEPLPPPGTPVYDLLSRLPADLHAVVQAVYVDGLTTAETAVLLGIPQGTVKSRLARARPLLQEVLR